MPRGRADTVSLRGLRIATYADDGLHATTTATGDAVRAAADALARAGTLVQWTRPDISEARSITERYWRIDESSGADVLRLFEDWDRFRSRMLAFMANHDAIVCPVSADTAPPLGQGGVEIFDYTLPYSLTGWPCVVVPAATCPQRLPIGVQVVAKAWCEHTALAVAARIETALGTLSARLFHCILERGEVPGIYPLFAVTMCAPIGIMISPEATTNSASACSDSARELPSHCR